MEYIEVTGRTKDEAIIKASMQLETPSDELDIQVITEGSKGFLGFGSKPAVIRAGRKINTVPEEAEIENVENPEVEETNTENENIQPTADDGEEIKDSQQTDEIQIAETEDLEVKKVVSSNNKSREHRRREPRQIEIITDENQIEEVKKKAEVFLSDVFQAMNIEADIHSFYNKTDGSLTIDFSGEDMGILIGKRGQTLDSLQYLTGLVINKGKNSYVKVKLDTENYRARRKETLENLARGIASRVRKTREDVVLEPMNPYERRIIHSALQGNHYVETVSEGEDPYRHIVVKPKRSVRR